MSRTPASYAGRAGRPWREVCARVYTEETHCWLCGDLVDPTLPARHPRARSADHLVQLQHGGHPTRRANLRLAHVGCNAARGNRLRHVPAEACACSTGQSCGVLMPDSPRGWVSIDTHSV